MGDILYYLVITIWLAMPSKKIDRLRTSRTLNPNPEKITDPLFEQSEFFDPRDLLQVRYEMVRCARTGTSLQDTASRFGTSVPTCVCANRKFRQYGLQGLMPQRRGPRGPHKITPDVVEFTLKHRADHGRVSTEKLVPLIEERFKVTIHPRGLYRALEKPPYRHR